MTSPVNLNQIRKAKARDDAKKQADANAVKFGRTKAEKSAEQLEIGRKARLLDGAKRENP
ncbi:MAG: DUF4169 family protein [Deltaproteobacteria bacterium]